MVGVAKMFNSLNVDGMEFGVIHEDSFSVYHCVG